MRAARVPSALKSAVTLARGEGGKGHRKGANEQESARAVALKALVIWLAGTIRTLEGKPAREAEIFRFVGRAQDWRGALKASPERFLLDPKTLAAGTDMQRETPLLEVDLTLIAEGPNDALALAELLIAAKQPRWLMGWRDICRSTDERTVIASVLPKVAVGHTSPQFFLNADAELSGAFLANLSSIVLDFVARQKIGGTHLTFGYMNQFPVLPPSAFSTDDLAFIRPRLLELTYTSYAMKAWAEDLGYFGRPFARNEDRRAQLRAELDVFFARKYGLTEEEQRYILDPAKVKGPNYPSETFRVLKEREIRQFGVYRTERLVLEAWRKLSLPQKTTPNIITFPTPSHPVRPTIIPLPTPVQRPLAIPDMPLVADGGWSRPGTNPRGEMMEVLLASLRTMSDPLPSERVCRAALLAMEPHLLVPHLEASQAAQWRRVIGSDANSPAPDSGQLDAHWSAAVRHFRAHGWMAELDGNWGPHTLPNDIQPGEWAMGRAAIVWDAMRHIGEKAEVIALFSSTLTRWRNAEAA